MERAEIQITGHEIGRGGWATVSIATFRGVCVAAKSIHSYIISSHNRRLFKREMEMAARIRHPNLVQFIGATQEGELVILTELMPTSLRKELEREEYSYFAPPTVISIGLDVARALNYLHLMQPNPIIHRDISSANVLPAVLTYFFSLCLMATGKLKSVTMVRLTSCKYWTLYVLAIPLMPLLKPLIPPSNLPQWTSSASEFSWWKC